MIRIRSTMGYFLAGVAIWSAAATGVSAAQPLPLEPAALDPVALTLAVHAAGAGAVAGNVASGSADRYGFDPGPYPNFEECERARAQYYDPSQLECVPAGSNR